MTQAKLPMYSYFQDLDLTRLADILLLVCLHDVFVRTKGMSDSEEAIEWINDLFFYLDLETIEGVSNWWLEEFVSNVIWGYRKKYAKEINVVRSFSSMGNPLPLPEEYQEVEGRYWN
jgi:hypothetical protein